MPPSASTSRSPPPQSIHPVPSYPPLPRTPYSHLAVSAIAAQPTTTGLKATSRPELLLLPGSFAFPGHKEPLSAGAPPRAGPSHGRRPWACPRRRRPRPGAEPGCSSELRGSPRGRAPAAGGSSSATPQPQVPGRLRWNLLCTLLRRPATAAARPGPLFRRSVSFGQVPAARGARTCQSRAA